MKSLLFSLSLLLAISFSFAKLNYDENGRAILGLRSIWLGFNRGFYKRAGKTAMVESCIDDITMNYYYNIVAIYEGSPEA